MQEMLISIRVLNAKLSIKLSIKTGSGGLVSFKGVGRQILLPLHRAMLTLCYTIFCAEMSGINLLISLSKTVN